MYDQKIGPSRVWSWVAAVILAGALACVGFAIAGFGSLGHQIDTFQRVKVPGRSEVTFTSAGGYLLYFEGPGMNRGRTGIVRVLLQSESDGSHVPISSKHLSERYNIGGHSGQAVASFTITKPGRYLLTDGQATSPAPTDIAVGKGIGAAVVRPVLLIVFGALAFAGGLVLLILTTLRRRMRRRAQAWMGQQPQYSPMSYGQQPPPGGPMPPGGGPDMPAY